MTAPLIVKACPFCGGEASVEEVPSVPTGRTMFSVGCDADQDGRCMGYQSLTVFDRKTDAIRAWNMRTRASAALPTPVDGAEIELAVMDALRRWEKHGGDAAPATFVAREVADLVAKRWNAWL